MITYKNKSMRENKFIKKDIWDKLAIISRPLSIIMASMLTAYLGYLGSVYLEKQQKISGNIKLYAELMSSRERSDSDLRKEMFHTTLSAFLNPSPKTLKDNLIKLELLAHNFHNSLDLAPLFEHLNKRLSDSENNNNGFLKIDTSENIECRSNIIFQVIVIEESCI